ncbi:beta-1,6-N-acetylglucosaminyltransferase [Actinoallomurus sp. CA-150999]|uniref:beta-1,6-N-acetylglucosaminyltransferase n=1 Tax=Actinoallomurus sp. CA-150999 TaxID=3239887 RepID=UPI003D8C8C7A
MGMGGGPLVVIVLSHRHPAQVARLVDRIRTGTDTVAVVHHDPSGEPLTLRPASDVALIPDARPCRWGRLSLVEAQWRSLRWVADNIPEFSWALLVSGQDHPIRPMTAIEKELTASPYDAYLRHFAVTSDPAEDTDPWQAVTRRRYLRKRRLPRTHRSVPLPLARRHPYRDGVGLYVGDMWFNLSATAVHGMLADPLADRLLRYLRYAPIPDEAFICSMARNTRPALSVANDSKRFIRWGPDASHPDLITADHLDEIRASDAFFARKVDVSAHPEIPDLLDQVAAERTAS